MRLSAFSNSWPRGSARKAENGRAAALNGSLVRGGNTQTQMVVSRRLHLGALACVESSAQPAISVTST